MNEENQGDADEDSSMSSIDAEEYEESDAHNKHDSIKDSVSIGKVSSIISNSQHKFNSKNS